METLNINAPRRSLSEIMAYENEPVMLRYIRDYGGIRADALRRFNAMKQYLVTCAVGRGAKVPDKSIDDMWHTFLLFTREYKAFCEEYLGQFVHHQPVGGFPPQTYTETRALAVQLFGSLDQEFWPDKAKADCGSGTPSGCHGDN